MPTELRNFLALSYDELEELNLKAKEQRRNRTAPDKIHEERTKYFSDENASRPSPSSSAVSKVASHARL